MNVFALPTTETLLRTALTEDLGDGDITTRLTVPPTRYARAELATKEQCVVAGMPLLERICTMVDKDLHGEEHVADGALAAPGDVLATLTGTAHSLLASNGWHSIFSSIFPGSRH